MTSPLSRLILRLAANTSSDVPIVDTLVAGTQGLKAFENGQVFSKSYALKPLRTWIVWAHVEDPSGTLVRVGNATAQNLLIGEVRVLPVPLTADFVINRPLPPDRLPKH